MTTSSAGQRRIAIGALPKPCEPSQVEHQRQHDDGADREQQEHDGAERAARATAG